ncbi:uncharacterized protein G2W53_007544 [Senna tora]|uniref:Uncharacterized protein n=1 Tax=Senna tora TaxID=362788 RepID=A0A834X6H6_9FABA|nr:uncharacterized protein G2W53_007544 [Senna tora]
MTLCDNDSRGRHGAQRWHSMILSVTTSRYRQLSNESGDVGE